MLWELGRFDRPNQRVFIAEQIKNQKVFESIATEMWQATNHTLLKKLRDPDPLVRWFAADILSRKQLNVERELIAMLKDPAVEVREAAHQALIRLTRGTDFGPQPQDNQAKIDRAVERWTQWLGMQDASVLLRSPLADENLRPVEKNKE